VSKSSVHSTSSPRILTFDLETIGAMNSAYGQVVNFGAKWLGHPKVYVRDIRSYPGWRKAPWDSFSLLNELAQNYIAKADMIVTFFGKDFDWKMAQTPLLKNDVILPPVPHVDLYWVGKTHTKIGRGSLDAALTYYGAEEQKYHVNPEVWRRAMHHDGPSLDILRERVASDVRATEWLYLKERPLVRQHPRLLAGRANCANCGSGRLSSQGFRITRAGHRHQRFQCQDCGAWGFEKER